MNSALRADAATEHSTSQDERPASPACPNCGAAGGAAYCPGCGQAAPSGRDYSLTSFALAIFDELTSYDSRIWTTVRALLFQPGLLARAHFDGRRARYIGPFRIFVVANLSAWLLIPYLNIVGFSLGFARKVVIFPAFWDAALRLRAELAGLPVDAFTARIEALGSAEDAAAVLLMIPLVALGLLALLPGRGYRFVQHLVFSAHYYCVHLLAALLTIGVLTTVLTARLKGHLDDPVAAAAFKLVRNTWTQHLEVAPLTFGYLYVGLKRAYRLTTAESLWRAALLAIWACVVGRAFFDLCFGLVLLFA